MYLTEDKIVMFKMAIGTYITLVRRETHSCRSTKNAYQNEIFTKIPHILSIRLNKIICPKV